jgi:Domain of unknown function (DUF4105)
VQHIRNFAYRLEDDFKESYYVGDYPVDELESADLITSYSGGDAIAHVFLTFGFRDGRHLAFSIETRRARGVKYSTVAGFFHHYELFYVVADERDLIGVRTDIRREQVYLYRLSLSPQLREGLFISYVDKVNQLASRPEWYNTVADNCTTGILNRAQHVGRHKLRLACFAQRICGGIRLFAGSSESETGIRGSTSLKSDRAAGATISATFSEDIRKGLPLAP